MPLPLDYGHQSIDAGDKLGAAHAAGCIGALKFDDPGVWGVVEWTDAAAAHGAADATGCCGGAAPNGGQGGNLNWAPGMTDRKFSGGGGSTSMTSGGAGANGRIRIWY